MVKKLLYLIFLLAFNFLMSGCSWG